MQIACFAPESRRKNNAKTQANDESRAFVYRPKGMCRQMTSKYARGAAKASASKSDTPVPVQPLKPLQHLTSTPVFMITNSARADSERSFVMFRHSRLISFPVATIVFFAAAWTVAQNRGGRDEYQILQARYGTARRNIDVTPRLKELARQNATFRLTNSMFGTDPDPGQVKTLRIYSRARNGQNRMFEYREKSIVDGSIFSGWSSGNWGQGGWNGGWGR
jgi:hypothetical protein